MYYVVQSDVNAAYVLDSGRAFASLDNAKAEATRLKKALDKHYSIVKVDWVWGTKTLGDLMREGRI